MTSPNVSCPYCGSARLTVYLGHEQEGEACVDVYECELCGQEFTEQEAIVERRVRELFAARFPPGSEGPDLHFDFASLYEQAWLELSEPDDLPFDEPERPEED
jgi:DNA-directed RNA polymerase subunit RPC12/RpoP